MNAPTEDERCGTLAGAQVHDRRSEQKCEPCREAARAYFAKRREDPDVRRVAREQRRARTRAYARLARMYPAVYRALYDEESAEIVIPPRKAPERVSR